MNAARPLAIALAAATLAAASSANATTYEVTPCADNDAVNLWIHAGTLGLSARGIECPGSSAAPTALPAGSRGVYVLQHPTGLVSSVGDPYAAWTLSVPPTLRLLSGTLRYRTGATTRSWRSWVTADNQRIAGCWPEAQTGVDACTFDEAREQFERSGTATVPTDTRVLAVGLQCSSLDGLLRPTTACSGSDPALINAGWAGVTGGTLTVADATAPTGQATISSATGWRRREDLQIHVSEVDVDDAGRGVCVLELQDATSGAPLQRRAATPHRSAWRQCTGLETIQLPAVGLPSDWPEGSRRITFVVGDGAESDANRTVVAEHVVRVDNTPPTIIPPSHPPMVTAGATITVLPVVDDALSGVASQATTVTDGAGRPVPIDDSGRVVVPAGAILAVTSTATDHAGNDARLEWSVGGAPLVVADPPDVPRVGTETKVPPPPEVPPGARGPSSTTPAPAPSSVARRCRRTAIRSARLTKRTRTLTVQGCAASSGRPVRLQLRLTVGGRGVTRTLRVRGETWRRVIRLRRHETVRSVRVVGSAWRRIVIR